MYSSSFFCSFSCTLSTSEFLGRGNFSGDWARIRAGAPAKFQAVNAHFSAQVHAFFNALHDLEDMADKQSSDELDLIRPDEGLQPVIRVVN
jgi:hypothetical protein